MGLDLSEMYMFVKLAIMFISVHFVQHVMEMMRQFARNWHVSDVWKTDYVCFFCNLDTCR